MQPIHLSPHPVQMPFSRNIIDEVKTRPVEDVLSRDELFRFAYVPFVIAELVWDYADSVILCASRIRGSVTRPLSRAIRQAREGYDRMRRKFIDKDHRNREIENGYVFEKIVSRITAQMLVNVRADIAREYPDLTDDCRDLLMAVYQCHILSRALLKFINEQSRMVEQRVGHPIGRILPPQYYAMDTLIPEFIGDKPASSRFRALMEQYITTLAVQIALIEYNDIKEND